MVSQTFDSFATSTPVIVVYLCGLSHVGSVEIRDLRRNTNLEVCRQKEVSTILMEEVNTYATWSSFRNMYVFNYCPGIHPTHTPKTQTGLIHSESLGIKAVSVKICFFVSPVTFVAASIAQILLLLGFLVKPDVRVT